jgi:hypothetical protein
MVLLLLCSISGCVIPRNKNHKNEASLENISFRIYHTFAGDMLVVLMLYCFAMTLLLRTGKKTKTPIIAIGVLIFAFCVEGLQAIDTLEWLGLSDHRWAAIVLGSTFDWWDLLAYSAGTLLILIIEKTV